MDNVDFKNANDGDLYYSPLYGTLIFREQDKDKLYFHCLGIPDDIVFDTYGRLILENLVSAEVMVFPDERMIWPAKEEKISMALTNQEFQEKLSKYPGDAKIMIEYCNPRMISYDKTFNRLLID